MNILYILYCGGGASEKSAMRYYCCVVGAEVVELPGVGRLASVGNVYIQRKKQKTKKKSSD